MPPGRGDSSREGPRRRGGPGRPDRRALLGLSRLQVVVVLTLLLGLAQIFFEDVLLFVATTNDGVSGVLADPMVAIAVPMTIALLMIVLLVGGAIVAPDDPRRRQRRRDRFDPRVRAGDEADGDSTTTDTERDAEESRSGPASGEGSRHRDG